ncbi:MAG: fibronectin type III domain-containing protein [Candidatus Eisenbacteria bacterium]
MSLRRGCAVLAMLCFVVLTGSCAKELESPVFENPLDPGYGGGDLPATPVVTSCLAGNRLVMLAWSVSDTSGIGSYRVYRSSGSPSGYSAITTTSALSCSDENVSNGIAYFYRVCAVTRDGREGRRSVACECTPAPFSVVIEDGRRYATSREVVVSFSAPPGVRAVLLSNAESFAGSSWQPFASSLEWQLEFGDGLKVVWAKFRDQYGQESVPAVDSITLDTRALVASLQWSPADSVHVPGSSLNFVLDAGEPRGQAWLEVGEVIESIPLFDDGTHGDATGNDGRYQVAFSLPLGTEFYKEAVLGHFVDEAGNRAPDFVAPRLMTVAAPPAPVVLVGLNLRPEGSRTNVELTWSQNNDYDFASYRIYRDVVEVTLSSPLLESIGTRSDTQFIDATVVSGREYRYKVYVFDSLGLSSPSNEKRIVVP